MTPSLALDAFRRRAYAMVATAGTVLSLTLALSVLAGDTELAVFAGAGVLLAAFSIVRLRRRNPLEAGRAAPDGDAMARRYRIGAVVTALLGLVLVAYGALWAVAGELEPALVFGVVCAGMVFGIAGLTYLNARWVEGVAAAVEHEPVRVICAEVREPWRSAPGALILTSDRVARLQATPSAVAEVGSIALEDIASMDANLSRGNLVVRGSALELSVRRAPPVQAYALFEALREAGVPEGGAR